MATSKTLPNGHPGEIILFNFPESVYGLRMARYLNLRGLPFSQIRVPPNMPRPLLQTRLGVNYRRIPIMAIGRDIYIDTRLILRKMESFFPDGRLGAEDSFNAAIEDMLEEFVIDGGPFWRTAGCTPPTTHLMQSDVWVQDRFDGSGGAFSREALKENRSWSISQLRLHFALVEKMLADGRKWLLNTEKPGLAEIHAGWLFDWAANMSELSDMENALGRAEFPNLHAWVERFRVAADAAAQANAGGGDIEEGPEQEDSVVQRILDSSFTEGESQFDERDVLGLKRGQFVTVGPADFGFTHLDEGRCVGLSRNEVVIEKEAPGGNGVLRLHYPRINFKIRPSGVPSESGSSTAV